MFRTSNIQAKKIPMPDSDVSLFGHALAGEAGDSRPQLTIVSRLAGQPTVAIWMHVGGANYVIASPRVAAVRHTCV